MSSSTGEQSRFALPAIPSGKLFSSSRDLHPDLQSSSSSSSASTISVARKASRKSSLDSRMQAEPRGSVTHARSGSNNNWPFGANISRRPSPSLKPLPHVPKTSATLPIPSNTKGDAAESSRTQIGMAHASARSATWSVQDSPLADARQALDWLDHSIDSGDGGATVSSRAPHDISAVYARSDQARRTTSELDEQEQPTGPTYLPETSTDEQCARFSPSALDGPTQSGIMQPPAYDTHAFQRSPPPLFGETSGVRANARGRGRGAPPAAPGGGRFPRWRGWLEKRALDRHYERTGMNDPATNVNRKKSWGAGVHDPNAIDDDETEQDGDDTEEPTVHPPLHMHQYGLRFIPHLPSQPLCAAYLDLDNPKATSNLRLDGNRQARHPRRKVLLIGLNEGLWVAQTRSASQRSGRLGRLGHDDAASGWNGDVRCLPVWNGMGVHQLAILSSRPPEGPSAAQTSSNAAFFARSDNGNSTEQDILLALCAAPSKPHQYRAHSYNRSTSSLGHSSAFSSAPSIETQAQMRAGRFGTGGGGSSSGPPPPKDGIVKMWNLDEFRRVVSFALDATGGKPLDLSTADDKGAAERHGKSRLSSRIRQAWASLGEPSSSRNVRSARRGNSDGDVDPFSVADSSLEAQKSAEMNPLASSRSRRASGLSLESFASVDSTMRLESAEGAVSSSNAAGRADAAIVSEGYWTALELAKRSIPINMPASGPHATTHGTLADETTVAASYATLFADETLGPRRSVDGLTAASKGKERDMAAYSKGALFFSVIEASKGAKAAGTWYLAVGTAKSLLVFEATPPRRGSGSRSWSFVRELWCPPTFTPKAASFVYCSTQAGAEAVGSSEDFLVPDSQRRHGSVHQTRNVSNTLRPLHGSGAAGPKGWEGADLSLFVSFGKRAVVIRVSDSDVREMDLSSGAGLEDKSSRTNLGHSGSGHAHNKHLSVDGLASFRKAKTSWVGFEPVHACVTIREEETGNKDVVPLVRAGSRQASASGQTSPAPHAVKWDPTEAGAERSQRSPTARDFRGSRDKRLPNAPAPQGLSFEAREQDEIAQRLAAVLAESDSDESEEEEDFSYATPNTLSQHEGVTLRDAGFSQEITAVEGVQRGMQEPRRPKRQMSSVLSRSANSPPSGTQHVIQASLALFSKGAATEILPLPLPANLTSCRPIASLKWTSTPQSVTAWARIVGLERARTAGAAHILGSSSATRPSSRESNGEGLHQVTLHVSVTLVAFLPSRIEMKRVTVRKEVELPFQCSKDAELSLSPPPPAYLDDLKVSGPVLDSRLRPTLGERCSSAEVEHEYLCGSLLVAPQAGGYAPTAVGPHPWRPNEAAGDGGVWGFDWRGGEDYRLFYVGAEV
ncbi:hypothetical protein CBOM_00428 [Ceraceosorus bombacis]|uniref:Uncharacterized protein n=1 Tax=Ceraceosorus bombacis TaxID=401625 RepID=A0A0P1B909_9BASI|nr:hypothetical protein CBOM_00428 [Ceraceosorus bombacis]